MRTVYKAPKYKPTEMDEFINEIPTLNNSSTVPASSQQTSPMKNKAIKGSNSARIMEMALKNLMSESDRFMIK